MSTSAPPGAWTGRFWTLLACVIFLITAVDEVLNLGYWKHHRALNFDVETYYHYLPATFIHGDPLDLAYVAPLDSLVLHPGQGQVAHGVILVPGTGHHVLKVTCGVALLEAPLFLIAHVWCLLRDPALATGYSEPYQLAVPISATIASFLGLLAIAAFLRRYVPDSAAAWAILILGCGTNLYFYSTLDGGMPHSYSFMLFAILLERTDAWYREPSRTKAAAIGFSLGLATLIRPTDALGIIIPLAWPLLNSTHHRLRSWIPYRWHFLVAAICAAVVLAPQVIYWKAATGHWTYWSYGNEGFVWSSPRILEGLFGYRKGWLVYTPLVALGLLGVAWMFFRRAWRPFAWPIVLFLLPLVYITFSWHEWWYGGGFGCRPLVGALPVLALPLGLVAHRLTERPRLPAFVFAAVVLAGIGLNRFQQDQYRDSILRWDGMTCARYWEIWGRSTWDGLEPFP